MNQINRLLKQIARWIEANHIKQIARLLIYVFLGITLLFLLSILPFGVIVSYELSNSSSYLYILARVVRILLVGVLCWIVRRQSRETLQNYGSTKKLECIVVGRGIILVLLRLFFQIGDRLYYTLASIVGISPVSQANFWSVIAWEQLVSVDLLWSVLLGFAILLFPLSQKHAEKLAEKWI